MLKIKFVVLAMLPLMLSACGGGGSSSSNDSNSNSNNSNSNEVKAELFPNGEAKLFRYSVDIDYEQEKLDFDKSEWNIEKGILLEKTKNPIFYNHYVTETNGLYVPETEQSYRADRGIRDSFIHSMTSTTWVTSPYNQAGFNDLKFTQKVKEIDLQGVRIVGQFAPALISMYEFEVNNGGSPDMGAVSSQLVKISDKFPKGQSAYRHKHLALINFSSSLNRILLLKFWMPKSYRTGLIKYLMLAILSKQYQMSRYGEKLK
ncbi:hypothetical protein ACFOGQ_00600 [Acinetobacter vivianii]